jgi:hypothetical protein
MLNTNLDAHLIKAIENFLFNFYSDPRNAEVPNLDMVELLEQTFKVPLLDQSMEEIVINWSTSDQALQAWENANSEF